MYIIDFNSMVQYRKIDPLKKRRIKRDLATNSTIKGIAGLRLGPNVEVNENMDRPRFIGSPTQSIQDHNYHSLQDDSFRHLSRPESMMRVIITGTAPRQVVTRPDDTSSIDDNSRHDHLYTRQEARNESSPHLVSLDEISQLGCRLYEVQHVLSYLAHVLLTRRRRISREWDDDVPPQQIMQDISAVHASLARVTYFLRHLFCLYENFCRLIQNLVNDRERRHQVGDLAEMVRYLMCIEQRTLICSRYISQLNDTMQNHEEADDQPDVSYGSVDRRLDWQFYEVERRLNYLNGVFELHMSDQADEQVFTILNQMIMNMGEIFFTLSGDFTGLVYREEAGGMEPEVLTRSSRSNQRNAYDSRHGDNVWMHPEFMRPTVMVNNQGFQLYAHIGANGPRNRRDTFMGAQNTIPEEDDYYNRLADLRSFNNDRRPDMTRNNPWYESTGRDVSADSHPDETHSVRETREGDHVEENPRLIGGIDNSEFHETNSETMSNTSDLGFMNDMVRDDTLGRTSVAASFILDNEEDGALGARESDRPEPNLTNIVEDYFRKYQNTSYQSQRDPSSHIELNGPQSQFETDNSQGVSSTSGGTSHKRNFSKINDHLTQESRNSSQNYKYHQPTFSEHSAAIPGERNRLSERIDFISNHNPPSYNQHNDVILRDHHYTNNNNNDVNNICEQIQNTNIEIITQPETSNNRTNIHSNEPICSNPFRNKHEDKTNKCRKSFNENMNSNENNNQNHFEEQGLREVNNYENIVKNEEVSMHSERIEKENLDEYADWNTEQLNETPEHDFSDRNVYDAHNNGCDNNDSNVNYVLEHNYYINRGNISQNDICGRETNSSPQVETNSSAITIHSVNNDFTCQDNELVTNINDSNQTSESCQRILSSEDDIAVKPKRTPFKYKKSTFDRNIPSHESGNSSLSNRKLPSLEKQGYLEADNNIVRSSGYSTNDSTTESEKSLSPNGENDLYETRRYSGVVGNNYLRTESPNDENIYLPQLENLVEPKANPEYDEIQYKLLRNFKKSSKPSSSISSPRSSNERSDSNIFENAISKLRSHSDSSPLRSLVKGNREMLFRESVPELRSTESHIVSSSNDNTSRSFVERDHRMQDIPTDLSRSHISNSPKNQDITPTPFCYCNNLPSTSRTIPFCKHHHCNNNKINKQNNNENSNIRNGKINHIRDANEMHQRHFETTQNIIENNGYDNFGFEDILKRTNLSCSAKEFIPKQLKQLDKITQEETPPQEEITEDQREILLPSSEPRVEILTNQGIMKQSQQEVVNKRRILPQPMQEVVNQRRMLPQPIQEVTHERMLPIRGILLRQTQQELLKNQALKKILLQQQAQQRQQASQQQQCHYNEELMIDNDHNYAANNKLSVSLQIKLQEKRKQHRQLPRLNEDLDGDNSKKIKPNKDKIKNEEYASNDATNNNEASGFDDSEIKAEASYNEFETSRSEIPDNLKETYEYKYETTKNNNEINKIRENLKNHPPYCSSDREVLTNDNHYEHSVNEKYENEISDNEACGNNRSIVSNDHDYFIKTYEDKDNNKIYKNSPLSDHEYAKTAHNENTISCYQTDDLLANQMGYLRLNEQSTDEDEENEKK